MFYLSPKQCAAAACLIDGLDARQAAEAMGITVHATYRRYRLLRHILGVSVDGLALKLKELA